MKKLKDFSKNEKMLLVMLAISIVLVVLSWDRISTKTKQVFDLYMGKPIEKTK
ncbi:MAG: hypothetical protein PHE56_05350 [Bacteroidales bacterium]|jgi:cell division protein FtsL|nr:hypothetical protein [Bacteroidales bacterium]